MSFFVESTPPRKPKTQNIRPISLGVAAIFVIMAVAQLFTFEAFPGVIAAMQLPGGSEAASIRAAVIVTLEVVALPFLLGMRLSPAMRLVSMVAGWMVIAAWTVATLWINLAASKATNSGLLGETVVVPVGWWNVFIIMSVGLLVAWVAWGMWPATPTKRKQ